jgi:hypothetical protein
MLWQFKISFAHFYSMEFPVSYFNEASRWIRGAFELTACWMISIAICLRLGEWLTCFFLLIKSKAGISKYPLRLCTGSVERGWLSLGFFDF